MKKNKKKWTTKNTHIKKSNKKGIEAEPKDWKLILGVWIAIAATILFIILVALNNHIVGYDDLLVFLVNGYIRCSNNNEYP